jgi:hypothetical protein
MFTTHSKEKIDEEIAKLQPLNYNQFRWWRRWDSKYPALHKYSPLISKIKNGDYEFSHYFWQAQYCEFELNEKLKTSYDTVHWMELTQLDRARRKRLWEDFEKDEAEKLKNIERDFTTTFKMSKEEYYSELDKFGGTLEEFYFHCESKFGTYVQPVSMPKRGRPAKNKIDE